MGGVAGMIMGFSGHFLKERISLGTMKARDVELQFIANPRLVNAAGRRVEPYAGPLAILTDDLSLSASEIFAGGMQAIGRARVFGQPTMGAALPSIYERLPTGDVLMHAVGDFVTASGVRLESRGVSPDETIRVTRQDLMAGRDTVLAAAINWIDKHRQKQTISSTRRPAKPEAASR
jgi:carboxyl-terminal processing protease